MKNEESPWEWAEFYVKQGFSVIPIQPRSKQPHFELLKAVRGRDKPTISPYFERAPTREELLTWFKGKTNEQVGIAIVAGYNRVLVLDVDDPRVWPIVFNNSPEQLQTWIQRSSKGLHVILKAPKGVELENIEIPGVFELKASNKYIVVEPSIHPSGARYEWLTEVEKVSVKELGVEEFQDFISKAKRLKKWWHIIDSMVAVWIINHRNQLALWLSGWLRKRGVAKEDAEFIVRAIAILANDEELKNRIEAVKSTYLKDVREIAGLARLKAELAHIVGSERANEIMRSISSNLGASGDKKEADKVTAVVNWVIENSDLYHDELGDGYVHMSMSDFLALLPIRSKIFQNYIRYMSYKLFERPLNDEQLKTVVDILEAKAVHEHPEIKLFVRVGADSEGNIWYDLCDERWRAVKITPEGWEVVENPPPIFRRYATMGSQVMPEKDGDLFLLLKFLNLPEGENGELSDEQVLVLMDVVLKFVPEIAHAVLVVHGVHGSTKTTLFRLIRLVVDPSAVKDQVLTLADSERELAQQLAHNWCAFYDNVSRLPQWASDMLSRAATGGGFTKRKLYTDEEDVVFNIRRCVGVNGINLVVTKPDLLDRALIIELPEIDEGRRKTEEEIFSEFEKVRPKILGGIFDAISKAMKIKSSIRLEANFRLADYCNWGCAVAEAIGIGAKRFLEAYARNRVKRAEKAVELSLVGQVIEKFMEGKDEWESTPTELLQVLKEVAESLEIDLRSKDWPRGPNSLSRELNNLKPSLKAIGILVETGIHDGTKRLIRLKKVREKPLESLEPLGADGRDAEGSHVSGPNDTNGSNDISPTKGGLIEERSKEKLQGANFLWRKISPAEKCSLCGKGVVKYEIHDVEDGTVLRRCQGCFKRMWRTFSKATWRNLDEKRSAG